MRIERKLILSGMLMYNCIVSMNTFSKHLLKLAVQSSASLHSDLYWLSMLIFTVSAWILNALSYK